MAAPILSSRQADRLRAAALTYAEVGQTRAGTLPSGYHRLRRRVTIGSGLARFEDASAALLSWAMHRGAGVHVRPSSETVVEGVVAVLRLGVGPVALRAPVRVVYVIGESQRNGFAYGTLPGHPERGEEAFIVELHNTGTVTFTITAFSQPASALARIAGPLGRALQGWATRQYLDVLQA